MDRRVLIVDDDPLMVTLLRKRLVAAEYEVLAATNGIEALAILRNDGPSLIVSDWEMPTMDGLELCRTIRSLEGMGFVYIIMLTALADKERVVEALDSGANDFLAKPFHHQELLARLNAGMRILSLEENLNRQQRELHKANAELAILNHKLKEMATTDELTGLANRREGISRLKADWALSLRHHQPLSCIMLDLDHFKRFNDLYGHDMGDLVLREIARALSAHSRAGDTVCRLGGEEFLIICPNTTGRMAVEAAERLRRAVESTVVAHDDLRLGATVSLGVAERDSTTKDSHDLLKKADEALYAAKAAGRNRVCIAGQGECKPSPQSADLLVESAAS